MKFPKALVVAAMALGVGAGSYGIASAASGTSTTSTTAAAPAQSAPPGATASNPWGNRRSDETLLTGDRGHPRERVAGDRKSTRLNSSHSH